MRILQGGQQQDNLFCLFVGSRLQLPASHSFPVLQEPRPSLCGHLLGPFKRHALAYQRLQSSGFFRDPSTGSFFKLPKEKQITYAHHRSSACFSIQPPNHVFLQGQMDANHFLGAESGGTVQITHRLWYCSLEHGTHPLHCKPILCSYIMYLFTTWTPPFQQMSSVRRRRKVLGLHRGDDGLRQGLGVLHLH